jgi:phage terminase large subunit-like protein
MATIAPERTHIRAGYRGFIDFFEHAAQNLEDEGVPVKPWRYQRNAAAAGTLHEIVSHGRLRHGGAELPRRHALAAEVRDREYGQVISKTKSREHIDGLMALAYAVDEATAMPAPRRSRYADPESTLPVVV